MQLVSLSTLIVQIVWLSIFDIASSPAEDSYHANSAAEDLRSPSSADSGG